MGSTASTVRFAARLQVRDETLDRGVGPDEGAATPPRDQVDVRIALHKTWRGCAVARAPNVDSAAKPGFRQSLDDLGSMRFHGGTSTGSEALAEVLRELVAPFAQLGDRSASTGRCAPSSQLRAPGGA